MYPVDIALAREKIKENGIDRAIPVHSSGILGILANFLFSAPQNIIRNIKGRVCNLLQHLVSSGG